MTAAPITGRITSAPSELLHDEVLAPQFRYEAEHLLPWYVAVEKVLALEYERMGTLPGAQVREIGRVLSDVTAGRLRAGRADNMSDIAFALERFLDSHLDAAVPAWHVDRSRNDFQACAQLLFGRQQLLRTTHQLVSLARTVHRLAARHLDMPMPGYTHLQTAQVITPGFYLAAVAEQLVHSIERLLATYDGIDRCPLGAGAMAGQELPWDRGRMARLLGFGDVRPHALAAVASRDWALEITAELSLLGTALSRFVTDLMTWGSSQYGFIELPDELAGISSAMPQKKNYPVLERIRGRTAHLSAFHLDLVLGQRNTPYSNSVEVSKEAGTHLLDAFTCARGVLRLLDSVLDNIRFDDERMLRVCEREYLGGFTLANLLTLDEQVPWRRAQVIAGQYIVAATARGLLPRDTAPDLLHETAAKHGVALADPGAALAVAFDVRANLHRRKSAGSAHPDAVRDLLSTQAAHLDDQDARCRQHGERIRGALDDIDQQLGL